MVSTSSYVLAFQFVQDLIPLIYFQQIIISSTFFCLQRPNILKLTNFSSSCNSFIVIHSIFNKLNFSCFRVLPFDISNFILPLTLLFTSIIASISFSTHFASLYSLFYGAFYFIPHFHLFCFICFTFRLQHHVFISYMIVIIMIFVDISILT